MLVTELLKLAPTVEQATLLETTMRACNAASDRVAVPCSTTSGTRAVRW
ncbi:hypothetical protein [Actinoplanes palleronii]|nr:hypothetical protein [Actinoplanes palleronii]